jgi:hypothetical protein
MSSTVTASSTKTPYKRDMLVAAVLAVAVAAPAPGVGVHALAVVLPEDALRAALVGSLHLDRAAPVLDDTEEFIDPRPTVCDPTGWYAVRVEPWLEDEVQGVWFSGRF